MQRPAFTLSFKVSYPQYRDYYIYMKNAGKSPRVTPILLTVLALLLGVAALAVYGMTKNTRLSLSVTSAAVLLWVASLVLRLGWYIRVRRRARRRYKAERLGKVESEVRFYEDYFSAHYPAFSFDGRYDEIARVDRTERLVVLRMRSGTIAVVPSSQWKEQMSRFLSQKVGSEIPHGAL